MLIHLMTVMLIKKKKKKKIQIIDIPEEVLIIGDTRR